LRYINQFIGRALSIVFTPFARIWSFMRRVIPGLKMLPTLKPPVLAASLSFTFVLTVVIVHFLVVMVFDWGSNESRTQYWQTLPFLILLMFAIPGFVYLFVRLLLAPPKSPFPDIDLAFEAGLSALQKNGISIKETPLYLVLGIPDSRKIKQMMAASNRAFDVSHVTADGQALYWYGSPDATYLYLSGVGNICQLTKDLGRYVSQTSSVDEEYAGGGDFKGTIDVRALGDKRKNLDSPVADDDAGMAPSSQIKQTIKAGDLRQKAEHKPLRRETAVQQNKTQLSSREKLAEQKRRIAHLCTLLQRHRRPVCSLNGILVAIVNRLIEEFPGQLARQAKSDLSTICEKTGVISTVTTIVTGFENDEGCREFVARLKEIYGEEFSTRRFGKSYRSWECPSPAHLKEISNESIENFDQYIYSIFTQHEALSARNVNGNRDMVKFLCWIYARFYEGLETTLMNGFSSDSGGDDDFPRFAGCYFMGVGDSPEQQFFSEGVFDRVDENQGELEWSSKILQREETWSLMSQLTFLVGLIAIGFLIFKVVTHESSDSESRNRQTPNEVLKVAGTAARPVSYSFEDVCG